MQKQCKLTEISSLWQWINW